MIFSISLILVSYVTEIIILTKSQCKRLITYSFSIKIFCIIKNCRYTLNLIIYCCIFINLLLFKKTLQKNYVNIKRCIVCHWRSTLSILPLAQIHRNAHHWSADSRTGIGHHHEHRSHVSGRDITAAISRSIRNIHFAWHNIWHSFWAILRITRIIGVNGIMALCIEFTRYFGDNFPVAILLFPRKSKVSIHYRQGEGES